MNAIWNLDNAAPTEDDWQEMSCLSVKQLSLFLQFLYEP